MAWESRERGGWYYTRSTRVNGRVVREYIGVGPIGELAAAEDAQRCAEREAQRQAWKAERERLEALDGPLGTLHMICSELVCRRLRAAGYHSHKGEWRKRREQNE